MVQLPTCYVKNYLLAGHAIVEVTAPLGRGAYKVTRAVPRPDHPEDRTPTWFVKALMGERYTYLGIIQGAHFRAPLRVAHHTQLPVFRLFAWFWQRVAQLPETVTVQRAERCGRCGKLLTAEVPSGICLTCAEMAR